MDPSKITSKELPLSPEDRVKGLEILSFERRTKRIRHRIYAVLAFFGAGIGYVEAKAIDDGEIIFPKMSILYTAMGASLMHRARHVSKLHEMIEKEVASDPIGMISAATECVQNQNLEEAESTLDSLEEIAQNVRLLHPQ